MDGEFQDSGWVWDEAGAWRRAVCRGGRRGFVATVIPDRHYWAVSEDDGGGSGRVLGHGQHPGVWPDGLKAAADELLVEIDAEYGRRYAWALRMGAERGGAAGLLLAAM